MVNLQQSSSPVTVQDSPPDPEGGASPEGTTGGAAHGKKRLLVLSLASLGIVFGDIGTSPLYAMRECFYGTRAIPPTPANILGVVSLILWSLILVISVKYLVLILRADNRGEGGILALATLGSGMATRGKLLFRLGLFGAALLYADGMITPAITVMGAVEGLHIATPLFDPYVVPLAVVILIGLFWFQSSGTTKVGRVFGPVTLLWFVALSLLGIHQIVRAPEILAAVNPVHGVAFFLANGWTGFVVLGAVFLVVTGGEALYADIGHFGTSPIRLTWFAVVLPGLALNYFGQGALLMVEPAAAENPFYRMAPSWALYPMVILSTAAAVMASQAIISGAFSLTMQAIQLGYSPRLRVLYTSAQIIGQVYVPVVNWGLMVACIGLVIGFGSSTHLAAAYGVAIATTMLITTILFYVVARRRWHWPIAVALPIAAFLSGSICFFRREHAQDFAWRLVPAPRLGRHSVLHAHLAERAQDARSAHEGNDCAARIVYRRLRHATHPACARHRRLYVGQLEGHSARAPAQSETQQSAPSAGGRPDGNHGGVALRDDVGASGRIGETARRLLAGETSLRLYGKTRCSCRFGADQRSSSSILPHEDHLFIGRETVLSTKRPDLSRWRGALFAWMTRNTGDVTSYFGLPPNGVVELGARVEV